MTRENFLWGAPRIHGELRMLVLSVSQATVSRYLPSPGRRPRQSWRTFVRNQSIVFGRHQDQEEQSDTEPLSLRIWSNWRCRAIGDADSMVCVEPSRGLGRPQPMSSRSVAMNIGGSIDLAKKSMCQINAIARAIIIAFGSMRAQC
jgi:hypothetical protein